MRVDMTSKSHPNISLLEKFFAGLKKADLAAISKCYAEHAYFEDIAFKRYGKGQIMEMWQLVCRASPEVEILSLSADDNNGVVRWNAKYRYGKTETKSGRQVINTLNSKFVFLNGYIVNQRDDSDPVSWARQAFPFPISLAAGWIEPLRRYMANRRLDKFLKERGSQSSPA
jgi:hypothetical protein